jgi:hypothetical protein
MAEIGAQHMKRWLGETWDDIVERTKHLRRQGAPIEALELGEVDDHETGSNAESDKITPKAKRLRLLH